MLITTILPNTILDRVNHHWACNTLQQEVPTRSDNLNNMVTLNTEPSSELINIKPRS